MGQRIINDRQLTHSLGSSATCTVISPPLRRRLNNGNPSSGTLTSCPWKYMPPAGMERRPALPLLQVDRDMDNQMALELTQGSREELQAQQVQ